MKIDIEQINALDALLKDMIKLLSARKFLRDANAKIDAHARENTEFTISIDVGFDALITKIPASFIAPLMRGQLRQESLSHQKQCMDTINLLIKQLQQFGQSLQMVEDAEEVTDGDDARA